MNWCRTSSINSIFLYTHVKIYTYYSYIYIDLEPKKTTLVPKEGFQGWFPMCAEPVLLSNICLDS